MSRVWPVYCWCQLRMQSFSQLLQNFLVWLRYCLDPTMRCNDDCQRLAPVGSIVLLSHSLRLQRTRDPPAYAHKPYWNSIWLLSWSIWLRFRVLFGDCSNYQQRTLFQEYCLPTLDNNYLDKRAVPTFWDAINMCYSIQDLLVYMVRVSSLFRKL